MTIDKATVARIAHLARIKMTPEEQDGMTREFNNILNWVNQLQEVNTDDVQPLTSVVETHLAMRDDVVSDGGMQEKILVNAPKQAAGFFVVPKVVE